MALIVQKFGGTSVGDVEKIQKVADNIARAKKCGDKIVVVVSAMAGVTNQLVSLCSSISDLASGSKLSEYDVALSSGEVVTTALLALALKERGCEAASILGWQLPIKTTSAASKALIKEVDISILNRYLANDVIPVIAGFQGLNDHGRMTTLGRGGSDTTAAAVAASIKADSCDIYTDVDGVYTSDPRLIPNARKIDILSYEEMLEFADMGAKVLHSRCVQIAMRHKVPIRVISSFSEGFGTTITDRSHIVESSKITGIAHNKNIALLCFKNQSIPFQAFADHDIHIEMLSAKDKIECIIPLGDLSKAQSILQSSHLGCEVRTDIAIVSVIGLGIKNDPTIFSRAMIALGAAGIEVMMMTSSEVKMSFMLHEPTTEQAVKILHGLLC